MTAGGPDACLRARKGVVVANGESGNLQAGAVDPPRCQFIVHSTLDDLPLTPVEFRLYAHAVRRGGLGGDYFETVGNAAKHCRVRPDTIRRARKRLQQLGLLSLIAKPLGSRWTYRVNQPGQWLCQPMPKQATPPERGGGTGILKPDGTPPERGGGTGILKPDGTPPERGDTKGIPLRPSPQGNPTKGERPLENSQGWQLNQDLVSVQKLIDDERQMQKPNKDKLSAWIQQKKQINAELEEIGRASCRERGSMS